MGKVKLEESEAKSLVDELGPHIDSRYDLTYAPEFPKTREDVCAVRRMAENGSTYGYDTIYLVWKTKEGELKHEELTNSSATKDYLSVSKIEEEGENIVVEVKDRKYTRNKKDLGLE